MLDAIVRVFGEFKDTEKKMNKNIHNKRPLPLRSHTAPMYECNVDINERYVRTPSTSERIFRFA